MNKKKGMAIASVVLGVCSAGAFIGNRIIGSLPVTHSSEIYQRGPYIWGLLGITVILATFGVMLGTFAHNDSEKKWKVVAIVGLVLSTIVLVVHGAILLRGSLL